MALRFFFSLYFISTFEKLPYGIHGDKYDNINEKDISKGVAKFILTFGGTEIVKPVDVSI